MERVEYWQVLHSSEYTIDLKEHILVKVNEEPHATTIYCDELGIRIITLDYSYAKIQFADEFLRIYWEYSDIVDDYKKTIRGLVEEIRKELKIDFIQYKSRTWRFKRPITAVAIFEKQSVVIKCEEMEIWGCGESLNDAMTDFFYDFTWLYNRLNSADDNNLSTMMLCLKKSINELITEVE